jgi:GH24 family phage-related lysozyme (muramidase)
MVRKVNAKTIALIRGFEGLARVRKDGLVYPYHDVVGFPTIGIGHLLSREKWEDLSKYPPLTVDEAVQFKMRDLEKFCASVEAMIKVQVTDNQFGAIVSLAFNVGTGAIRASSLLKKLNRGDPLDEVAQEFLKWNKAGGIVYKGLTRRRVAEMKLFLSA